jgi:hypothetical protein
VFGRNGAAGVLSFSGSGAVVRVEAGFLAQVLPGGSWMLRRDSGNTWDLIGRLAE